MNTRRLCQIALGLFAACTLCGAVFAESFPAVVSDVTAGDIYQITTKSNKKQIVVLYGVVAGSSPLTARTARDYAREKALGKQVTVRIIQRRPGLTLVELALPDNSNLGHVMLRNGLLKWDSLSAPQDQGLKDLEALARQEHLGVWASLSTDAPPTVIPSKAGAAAATGGNEKNYERRLRAGYDILEGRSYTDEKGVPTLVLRGNGQKIVGFENAAEEQRMAEYEAQAEEEAAQAAADAAAQAEIDQQIYEEQLRQEEANRQAQMQSIQALNQQLMYGGVYRGARVQVLPMSSY